MTNKAGTRFATTRRMIADTKRRAESAASALRQEIVMKSAEFAELARQSREREDQMAAEIAVLRMELEKTRSAAASLREQLEYARVKIDRLERCVPPEARDVGI
ncbi:MAG TPA: hypothetical protein VI643_02285 [Planctomycetota bacterium]|nr:hypothetical protein [Planctomycetota bacterium]